MVINTHLENRIDIQWNNEKINLPFLVPLLHLALPSALRFTNGVCSSFKKQLLYQHNSCFFNEN